MSEDILINISPGESRVALLKIDVLQEIYIERKNRLSLLGNIYKGKVTRLAPGMQAAFVDIGLERSAFLHLSDLVQCTPQAAGKTINDFLKEGQEVAVQV